MELLSKKLYEFGSYTIFAVIKPKVKNNTTKVYGYMDFEVVKTSEIMNYFLPINNVAFSLKPSNKNLQNHNILLENNIGLALVQPQQENGGLSIASAYYTYLPINANYSKTIHTLVVDIESVLNKQLLKHSKLFDDEFIITALRDKIENTNHDFNDYVKHENESSKRKILELILDEINNKHPFIIYLKHKQHWKLMLENEVVLKEIENLPNVKAKTLKHFKPGVKQFVHLYEIFVKDLIAYSKEINKGYDESDLSFYKSENLLNTTEMCSRALVEMLKQNPKLKTEQDEEMELQLTYIKPN
jgi:hypothetical protein